MTALDAVFLIVGGIGAGIINTMAGGGSLLTVPLLTLAGVPGNVANGTNRIGVLTQNASSIIGFRRLGVSGIRRSVPILIPVMVGSLLGSIVISRLADDNFETIFGLIMVPLLILAIRKPRVVDAEPWSPPVSAAVFFAVGVYGGAFQAGIGIILIVALARTGLDLVMANAIKVVVSLAVTLVALPVFIINGDVDWVPGLVLAVGFSAGGYVGASVAVKGGERVIRPVMIAAVLALAGRLVGLY